MKMFAGGTQHRARLSAEGRVGESGEFEVMAITAGEGNGWLFGAESLRESLGLWDGVECFIDHAAAGSHRSLRDLAGLLYAPQWDAERLGVRCKLRALGPSAEVLRGLGRQMLESAGAEAAATQAVAVAAADAAAAAREDTADANASEAGPAGAVSEPARDAAAARAAAGPRVGFSADVIFSARGRRVEKILRVLSVDLVFDPARGGRFVGKVNSRQLSVVSGEEGADSRQLSAFSGGESGKSRQMAAFSGEKVADSCQLTAVSDGQGSYLTHGGMEMASVDENGQEKVVVEARLGKEEEPLTRSGTGSLARPLTVTQAVCAQLLESELAAARLPQPVSEQIRRQMSGRVFEPGELAQAIQDGRRLVSELTGPGVVQGPRAALSEGAASRGAISGMVSSEDQFSAALFDVIGAERPAELAQVRAARLSGIRELYTLMTGDAEFNGGYHPERAQFATTANLPGLLKNAMNKLIAQEWQELGRSGYRWWEPVVSVEHFTNLHQITGLLVGEVSVLPTVAEGAAYSELAINDSAETGDWGKYGGYIGLTLEMFERDETHKLRQYPRKLASAALRRISALVGSVFTTNSGAGPEMKDTHNVFDADYHHNLGSDALSAASWEAASAAIYQQPILALDARYLIVPRALRLAARQILYPSWEREANIFSENQQRGAAGDVITCPEFSDARDWAAAADPRLAPAIIVGERFGIQPEIFIADQQVSGALFTNDEMRMKVRHWVSVFVADYRPLYKAGVV